MASFLSYVLNENTVNPQAGPNSVGVRAKIKAYLKKVRRMIV